MGPGSADAPRLRSLLLRSWLLVTAIAVAVLALPLAIALQRANASDVVAQLEREATRIVALTPDDATSLPTPMDPRVSLGLYAADGRLLVGDGPATDEDARGALTEGATRVQHEDGVVAVYVPFDQPGGAQTTVRAVMPESVPQGRTYRAWGLLLLACLAAFGVAALVAVRSSRRLALPFERIADAAHQMREGGMDVRVGATGVAEGDEVGRMLEEAALATAQRVHREIELAQDTNHQVRTPVAAARLTLDAALTVPGSDLAAAAEEAIAQLDRASAAIDEVLALRRPDGRAETAEAGPVIDELVARWTAMAARSGRTLVARVDGDAAHLVVAAAALRQALEVLLDNALRHGSGTVTVLARDAGGSLVVDVEDEGAMPAEILDAGPFSRGTTTRADGSTGGLGLPLARSLAESVGGRLALASPGPARFTLLLPESGQEDGDA